MRVDIDLAERSYPVFIGFDLLATKKPLADIRPGSKTLIVTNETVAPLYLQTLINALPDYGVHTLVLPDGEKFKTLETWSVILNKLVEIQATRDTTLFTLGGGVIGDMGGYAAASYMRGIRYIQVPTTLLAQVDASVGGKTGINHPLGKNLVGAFHQPSAVLVDIATLATLPSREFSAGMAEIIKIACVRDAEFLNWLEANTAGIMDRNAAILSRMIKKSVVNKATIVARDERESGIRAVLNFGHSFAHALETLTGYDYYLHGEAVAIGMLSAVRLSEQKNLCKHGFVQRLGQLLHAFGLPGHMPDNLRPEEIVKTMKLDKKASAGSHRLILIKAAGHGIIDDSCDDPQIIAAIRSSQAKNLPDLL